MDTNNALTSHALQLKNGPLVKVNKNFTAKPGTAQWNTINKNKAV